MTDHILTLPSIENGEDKSCILKNRIRKNYRHLRKWAKRTQTDCFRVYDRDIKECPVAIDFYAGRFSVHYFSSDRDQDEAPDHLYEAVNEALSSLFGAGEEDIYWRSRVRRKKFEQYEKQSEKKDFFTSMENGVPFRVNLADYLDTGLFLDHRDTRQMVAACSKGKRLLNLFAYTCSFSVHAALQGASFTKSVDLSNTYTEWGRENFRLNGVPSRNHPIIQGDCLRFLDEEIHGSDRYDVIIIDPPTLSRSKKMMGLFDVQEDYGYIIAKALQLLNKGGTLFFSTNSRRFKFDASLFSGCSVENISEKTIPQDFQKKKIHQCWKLTLLD